MALVSFIVPIFNAKKYLDDCILSLVSQTVTDIEILLVDDGSTDGSGSLCDIWQKEDTRIKVLHQKNAGVSVARNAGIELATGEWIVFIDADDWIEKNTIEYILPHLDNKIDICFFGYTEIHPHRTIEKVAGEIPLFLGLPELEQFQLGALDRYYKGTFDFTKIHATSPWTKIYRASILHKNKILFPEGIISSEDLLFNLQVYNSVSSGIYLPFCAYNYRRNDSSVTQSYNPEILTNFALVLQALQNWLDLDKEKKEAKYIEAFRRKSITFLQFCTILVFCHPQNPNNYKNRRHSFLLARNEFPYKDSCDKVNLEGLPFFKFILLWLIKQKCFFTLNLLIKISFLLHLNY